jgi:hypothetical protein
MRHQRFAYRTSARDEVDDTAWYLRARHDFEKLEFRQRSQFRRLDDNRATGRERGRKFPGGSDHREIPRHDERADTDCFVADNALERSVGQLDAFGRPQLSIGTLACVVAECRGRVADVQLGFEPRLAIAAHLQLDQFRRTAFDHVRNPPKQCAPFGHAGGAPSMKRSPRCLYSRIDIGGGSSRDAGEREAGAWINHSERRPTAVPPCAVHEHAGFSRLQLTVQHVPAPACAGSTAAGERCSCTASHRRPVRAKTIVSRSSSV